MSEVLTNKYSANATANGFEFEYAAALLIYLENIRNADSFGVEKKDDIYLKLKNGDKIYGQAKSSLEPDRIAENHFDDIIESIRTLSENNDDAIKLISIFNYFKPLGVDDSFSHDRTNEIKKFADLTTATKEKLKNKIKDKYVIDFDKLEFWFLRFEGSDAMADLKTYLDRKLSLINELSHFDSNELIKCWMFLIMDNARSKEKLVKSSEMAGTLFNNIIKSSGGFNAMLEYSGLKDVISYEEEDILNRKFNSFIEISSLNFMIYNKIRSSYYDFRNQHRDLPREEGRKKFVDEYSNNQEILKAISSLFEGYDNKNILESLMSKLLVSFICVKSEVIKKVSEVFGYEN